MPDSIDMLDLRIPVDPENKESATIEDLLGVLIRALNKNKMLVAGCILPTNQEIKTARIFGNNSRETIKKILETGIRLMDTPENEVGVKHMGSNKVIS